MVIDRASFAERGIHYLGWELEGAVTSFRHYTWFARSDDEKYEFSVVSSHRDYQAAKEAGLALARGKIFLGTWSHLGSYTVDLNSRAQQAPMQFIRNAILGGLARLYEGGHPADVQIDLKGVASEMNADHRIVLRAVK
jgi:hypothetical protein